MAAEALLSEVVHAENQFPQVQHLAQADYGVLLHQLGKVEVCRLASGMGYIYNYSIMTFFLAVYFSQGPKCHDKTGDEKRRAIIWRSTLP